MGPHLPRSAIVCVLLATSFVFVGEAAAQRGRATPVLHEPLPHRARMARSDKLVKSAGTGLADAIDTAAGRIPKPDAAKPDSEQAPLYEARDKLRKAATDKQTRADGTLHYRAVFNPTVAPFKRDIVFDRVNAAGELEQSGLGRRPTRPLGAARRSGHELFWGHVTVELVAGKHTPLPSIAPSSAIVQAQAHPPRPLTFFVDAAGNFSVTSTRSGTAQLRFVMDAPSSYFGAPIGGGPVRDDPTTPALPAAVQARMEKLWAAIGVSRSRSRRGNVRKLAEYFRSFEPGDLPPQEPGDDLVSSLIVARRGVCRHRSHAFVTVAHSLGIPAHYVINDAHAFAEAWVPGVDGRGHWQRVDLGGGADALRLHGADRKHLHDPLFRDPLPRPQQYAGGITRLEADGRLNDSSWAGARKVLGAGGMVGRGGRTGGDGTAATDKPGAAAADAKGGNWLRERARKRAAMARNVAAPDVPPSRPPAPTSPRRIATTLKLDRAAPIAYVGESLKLYGKLRAASGSVPAGLAIAIWLVDPRDATKGRKLGGAVTRKGGDFAARIAVPMSAKLGEYDLVLHFAGRGKLAPSWSK